MSGKFADYLIYQVRYNAEHTHIDEVKYRVLTNDGKVSGHQGAFRRQEVVSQIETGIIFYTIFDKDEKSWTKGAPVTTVEIKGTKYIKTVRDATEQDNLGNLPEY